MVGQEIIYIIEQKLHDLQKGKPNNVMKIDTIEALGERHNSFSRTAHLSDYSKVTYCTWIFIFIQQFAPVLRHHSSFIKDGPLHTKLGKTMVKLERRLRVHTLLAIVYSRMKALIHFESIVTKSQISLTVEK